jgi:hypothetical protein
MTVEDIVDLEKQTDTLVKDVHHHIWELHRIDEMVRFTDFHLIDATRCGSDFCNYANESLVDIKQVIKQCIHNKIIEAISAATASYEKYNAACKEHNLEPHNYDIDFYKFEVKE